MRRITTGILASIALVGLLSACSSDSKSKSTTGTGPANATVPGGGTAAGDTLPPFTLPPGIFPTGSVSLPPGVTSPTLAPGLTIPPGGTFPPGTNVTDLLMAQLQAVGMKVDRPCLDALLQDKSFRSVVMSGSTPTGEMIQNLIKCLRA